jgi:hypothetical protein
LRPGAPDRRLVNGDETPRHEGNWKAEIGRELARQCPSLVVVCLLCGAFLWFQDRAFTRLNGSLQEMKSAIEHLGRGGSAVEDVVPGNREARR